MPTSPTPLPTIPPFPALADKATGTYNSKAYDWATGWADDIAPAIEALADNAYDNAVEAATSASTATTQATTATTQAGNASASAAAAAASAASATNAANVAGTSTSSVAVATAVGQSKTFRYVEASRSISVGMFLVVADTASPTTNWMLIQVSAWDSVNKDVTGTVITYAGSGTYNAWTLSLSSAPGASGGTATSTVDLLTGTNIASASTVNLNTATGNRVHITGTTTITAWTLTRGPRTVIFDGALQLTYHATNNRLNSNGANVTVEAGDMAYIESDGTTVFVNVVKKNGASVGGASVWTQVGSTVNASSSATIDLTLSGSYSRYMVVADGITVQNDGDALWCRFMLSGSFVSADYKYHINKSSEAGTPYSGVASGSDSKIIVLNNLGSNAVWSGSFTMNIPNPANTSRRKSVYWQGVAHSSASGVFESASGIGAHNNSVAALTQIRFLASTGNIVAGAFSLYGMTT